MRTIILLAGIMMSLSTVHADTSRFLWGAAFSSHQVEGGNDKSDWWDWEHVPGRIERGETTEVACDHYNRFREDFALAQQLGLNTVRLSVSWSRIEPSPGFFDPRELNHYRDVVMDLRARGIEPVVTLHHFTHPRWFHEAGGWTSAESPKLFAAFAEAVATALYPHVSIWITFNEPMVQITEGYLKGAYPPGISDFKTGVKVFENLVRAHAAAAKVLREHTPPSAKALAVHGVGIALNLNVFHPAHDPATEAGQEDLKGIAVLEHLSGWAALEALQTGHLAWDIPPIPALKKGHREALDVAEAAHSLDWVGVNYYSRYLIERDPSNDLGVRWIEPPGGGTYPEGMGEIVKSTERHLSDRLPIVVSENGIADALDAQRAGFIQRHLESLRGAISTGSDVRGYWYWSLTDNFEWNSGYSPRFGLVEIDYATLKRTVRPSARWYHDFIANHPEGP
ncbi:MAG: family 1 glycosylhydrolase [Deltaproteobacteria bacterium]|nr:family 1 glycosylhydrolase [Deltaproteobacteria bacterium]